jgi:hypothetical protein
VTPLRDLARDAARRVSPGYMADRARGYERDLRQRLGVPALAERLVDGEEPVVLGGPFAGMRYPRGCLADVDAAAAKLLGTYETEVSWAFERAIERGTGTFVDIGCADGYYAVGMAHASPATTTYAFDLSASARRLCRDTAVASGVADRVRVEDRFTVDGLASLLGDATLVLCDIEGGEVELLTERAARALARSVVVVEVHEDERTGAGSMLRSAFRNSHDAVLVQQQPRRLDDGRLTAWSAQERESALRELRGPLLHWIVFEPKIA